MTDVMTPRKLAEKIIATLYEHSAPGNCTWGDNNPEAHGNLFGFYREDLICDVEKLLKKHGKGLQDAP